MSIHSAWPVFAIGVPGVLLAGVLPSLLRMQRLLAAGYGTDDLRAGIREYWRRRREEDLFEVSSPAHSLTRKTIAWLCGATTAAAVATNIAAETTSNIGVQILNLCVSAFALGANGLALRDWSRLRSIHKLGQGQINFFNSTWGERFVRFAGIGTKKRAPAESLPQLTEVALGRATDALYDALPKDLRRQLKQLPETVKNLEAAARTLRAEMDRCDSAIAELGEDTRRTAASPRWEIDNASDQLRGELRSLREHAADRLATTVAALENIRLDLLRLQLGDVLPESVTTSLDVARQVAADLHQYVAATRDVERLLEDHTTPVGG
jgi:hypothetical protein